MYWGSQAKNEHHGNFHLLIRARESMSHTSFSPAIPKNSNIGQHHISSDERIEPRKKSISFQRKFTFTSSTSSKEESCTSQRKKVYGIIGSPEKTRNLDFNASALSSYFGNTSRFTKSSTDAFIDRTVCRKLPQLFSERTFNTENYNKVFSSCWISENEVIAGTKCNKILLFNTINGKVFNIPYKPRVIASPNDGPPIPCSGIHSISMNPSKTRIAIGAGKPTEFLQLFSFPDFEPIACLRGHHDMVFTTTWLDDETLISGSRDTTIKTWKLQKETNAIQNVDEEAPKSIYSQSKRHSSQYRNETEVIHPILSEKAHDGKVRDSKYDPATKTLATLSTDGFVKLWDVAHSQVNPFSTISLYHKNEIVCMGYDSTYRLYAVGSQSHVSMIDPRANAIVNVVNSLDSGWGVRSLDIYEELITIGGGYGRVSFYDIRANKYLEWTELDRVPFKNSSNTFKGSRAAVRSVQTMDQQHSCLIETSPQQEKQAPCNSLKTTNGWLKPTPLYLDHLRGLDLRNAIYTIAYDQSRTRLFAAGGPLQLNLYGSYASIW